MLGLKWTRSGGKSSYLRGELPSPCTRSHVTNVGALGSPSALTSLNLANRCEGESQPAPAGESPAPAGESPAPAGESPAPAGESPAPADEFPGGTGAASSLLQGRRVGRSIDTGYPSCSTSQEATRIYQLSIIDTGAAPDLKTLLEP
eukprot:1179588-Prorocentrum_minimum.AAC.1